MTDGLLRVCGLWLRTSKAGRQYLAGRFGGVKVLIWANPDKVAEEDPSHILLFGQPAERQAATQPTDSPTEAAPNSAAATTRRPRPLNQRRFRRAARYLAPDTVSVGSHEPNDTLRDLWREGS